MRRLDFIPCPRSALDTHNLEGIKLAFEHYGLTVEDVQRVHYMWWYVLASDANLYLMDLSNGGGRGGFYLEGR